MSITKQVANESELRFASEFVRSGWSVFFPFGEDGPVDLVIHKGGEFKKVQIKATQPKGGVVICKLRSTNNWSNKKYSVDEVDLLGLYDYKNQKGYLVPLKNFEGMAQLSLRIEPTKNNQNLNVRFSDKYFFF